MHAEPRLAGSRHLASGRSASQSDDTELTPFCLISYSASSHRTTSVLSAGVAALPAPGRRHGRRAAAGPPLPLTQATHRFTERPSQAAPSPHRAGVRHERTRERAQRWRTQEQSFRSRQSPCVFYLCSQSSSHHSVTYLLDRRRYMALSRYARTRGSGGTVGRRWRSGDARYEAGAAFFGTRGGLCTSMDV